VNVGDLPGNQEAKAHSAGVRATIVAGKSGNADGAKGGRKADAPSEGPGESESKPPSVSETNKQGGEGPTGQDLWQRYKAHRKVWSEGMLMSLDKGVKGNKWFSLIDKVWSERTLRLAWEQVQSNAGACGIDGMTVAMFNKDSSRRLLVVNEQLKEDRYQPEPVKRVWIPKLGSTQMRPLGIPTVTDRVVQTALRMVIEPIFEREFAPHSYGFRPGRCCQNALGRVEELLKEGHTHVVDIDIKGYFDNIPQEKLLKHVGERIADGRVIQLLESFLKSGVMEDEGLAETEAGTPQGGVISPLLANIYLNPLDWLMVKSGYEMVRYADDMVVMCRDAETATKALNQVAHWMQEAGLELHPEKTRIVDMGQPKAHFDFLGYQFYRGQKGNLRKHVRQKSRQKLQARLKPLTRRNSPHSQQCIIAKINPILRGWYNYFKHVNRDVLDTIDGWVRRRLRNILHRRKGRRGYVSRWSHKEWTNSYFDEHGLFCLEGARTQELINLQNEENCRLESRMREIRPSGSEGGVGS
jgi:RNA-directed DNA polymerase